MSDNVHRGLLQARALVSLLGRAGVGRNSVIRVTGSNALAALLWLCRHGYDQVGYLRPDACTHEEAPDALIVAHTCSELELKRLLPTARLVRPGGVLLFQLRGGADEPRGGVDWMLESSGYRTERRWPGERRALILARRRGAARQLAA